MSALRTHDRLHRGGDAGLFSSTRVHRTVSLHDAGWAANALALWVTATSLLAFVLMVHDKRQARRARRRTRERTLLIASLIGGAPGGWLAMTTVRHKTRHLRFRIVLPLFAVLWIALLIVTRRP